MADDHPAVAIRSVRIPVDGVTLDGDLSLPDRPRGLVLFAHGSGSSRRSTRNRQVARELNEGRLATLLFDLLTVEEEALDSRTARLRFDIKLLADRLAEATDWARSEPDLAALSVGYFGASTGGGAALVAASARPEVVRAVVSRGGRPDLAGEALPKVQAPTLLLVGGLDVAVIAMNQEALASMTGPVELEIIPGASHLFEEPGTLDVVASKARAWFERHL